MAEHAPPTREDDEPSGAPEWMVTFSDCMTLLLTFFVLLLSFSSFKPRTLGSLATSFAKAMPAVGLSFTSEQDSVYKQQHVEQLEKMTQGSETRTLVEKKTSNYMREKKPLDFKDLKVFTIESGRVFLGNGAVLSKEGREICDGIAVFLSTVANTNRVVISENGPQGDEELSLARAYTVLEYISGHPNIRKGRFNITSSSTMRKGHRSTRYLEITVLDREMYQ